MNSVLNIIRRAFGPAHATVFFCVLLLFGALPADARHDPSWRWRTLRHAHFTIYYPAGHEVFADRVFALCDDVYEAVTGYLEIEPRHCPVVLHPGTDEFNGFFAPFPNRISLIEAPPGNVDVLGPVSDPLKALFVHEFTHFVHITARTGWYGDACRILGDGLAVSNALSPGWMIEGLTTVGETLFSDGGRGRSTVFRHRMMSFVNDEGPWNLSAAGVASPYRPPGDRIYLGGYFMVDYLRRIYGEDAPARMVRRQAARPLGGTRGAIRYLTGASPEAFHREFTADLQRRAEEHVRNIPDDLPSGRMFPHSAPDSIVAHSWTADGRLLALRRGYERRNALLVIDPRQMAIEREIYTGRISSRKDIRILADKRLLICEAVYHPFGGGDLDVAELVVFDPITKKRDQRTTRGHVFSADIGPEGDIVAVRRNGPGLELVLLDAAGSTRVLASHPDVHVHEPCWTPDGKTIAATIKTGRYATVALIDPVHGRMRPLFEPEDHACANPTFSPDGRWLVFASDRTGVRNLFAWDMADHRLFQLTSVLYGASMPRVSPDGATLSFLAIQNGLDQLWTIPFAPEAGRAIPVVAAETIDWPDAKAAAHGSMHFDSGRRDAGGMPLREAYKPFIHIPFFGQDEDGGMAGVFLAGGDPISLNVYQFHLLYGMKSARPGYDLLLTNRSLWPDLHGRVYDHARSRNIIIGAARERWFRERGVELAADLAILQSTAPDRLTMNLAMGMRFRHLKSPGGGGPPLRHQSEAVFVDVGMKRLPDYPARSVTPGWGQTLRLACEAAPAWSSSNAFGHNILLTARQYMPSPLKHHGFEWRVAHQRQRGPIHYDSTSSIPRGYDHGAAEGGFDLPRTLTFSGEYRFPLWYADRGIGLLFCHMHLLKGSLFVDYGAGWDGGFRRKEWSAMARTSTGVTLAAETQVMAWLPLTLEMTMGYNPGEGASFMHFLFALGL